jgi:hypothetical protein
MPFLYCPTDSASSTGPDWSSAGPSGSEPSDAPLTRPQTHSCYLGDRSRFFPYARYSRPQTDRASSAPTIQADSSPTLSGRSAVSGLTDSTLYEAYGDFPWNQNSVHEQRESLSQASIDGSLSGRKPSASLSMSDADDSDEPMAVYKLPIGTHRKAPDDAPSQDSDSEPGIAEEEPRLPSSAQGFNPWKTLAPKGFSVRGRPLDSDSPRGKSGSEVHGTEAADDMVGDTLSLRDARRGRPGL